MAPTRAAPPPDAGPGARVRRRTESPGTRAGAPCPWRGGWAALAALGGAALGGAIPGARAVAQAPVAPALPTLAARAATPAGAAARAAQRTYERERLRTLYPYGGAAQLPCQEHIGRLCYWDNNGEWRPPADGPAAARARHTLLAALARAATADPADDWVAGQRVRYQLEAAWAAATPPDAARQAFGRAPRERVGDRPSERAAATTPRDSALAGADSAAAACRGTAWWCQALVGLAHHAAGRHAAAAAAHSSARALLPDAAARCAWDDLSPWLPPGAARAYRRLPCGSAERARYERRAWRLAQPFWTLPANDLRAELAARRTLVRLHAAGPNPQALPWGDDLAASDVRYGVPTAWSARDAVVVGLGPASPAVVGHEPTPSYDFWPDARALDPAALLAPAPRLPGAAAWALRRDRPQTRYAPAYAAAGVYALPHQLARFRRGDTLVVVGTYDAAERGDSVPPGTGTGPVHAGLVLDDLRADSGGAAHGASGGEGVVTVGRDRAPRQGALVVRVRGAGVSTRSPPGAAADTAAPAASWLASLEVFDPAAVRYAEGETRRGRAGRARLDVAPLPRGAALSDLLVVRPGLAAAAAVPTLDAAVDSAAGAPAARIGEATGLYWEQYGAPRAGGPAGGGPAGGTLGDTVVVSATRLDPSWRERAGALIGRPVVLRPVRVRYVAPPAAGAGPDAPTGRVLTLRWPEVPPGAYRVDVTVPDAGGVPATASTVVRVAR